jgi:hypothetical protein
MTDLEFTRADVNEAFINVGKLMARLPSDEAKRLHMMIDVIASYMSQLAEENDKLRNSDDFDMDGRC